MKDYSLCKLYAIRSRSRPDLVYYGHTIKTLNVRYSGHKSKNNNCTSYQITKLGDSYIELLENYPCKNYAEASARESWWITNNPCVNTNVDSKISIRKNIKLQKLQETKEHIKNIFRQYCKRETFQTLNNLILTNQQLYIDIIDEFTINFKYYYFNQSEFLKNFTKFQFGSYMLFNEIYNNSNNRILFEKYLINSYFDNYIFYFLAYNTYLYCLNNYMNLFYNNYIYNENLTHILNNWITLLDIYTNKSIKNNISKQIKAHDIFIKRIEKYKLSDESQCKQYFISNILPIIEKYYDYLQECNQFIYKETMDLFNYKTYIK